MTTTTNDRPFVALALATGFGLGYLPIAPGTWGSLGSAVLYVLVSWSLPRLNRSLGAGWNWAPGSPTLLVIHLAVIVILGLVGVWASGHARRHFGTNDPRPVVIDEISGQQIAYLGLPSLGLKYLLAGFLLFRAFDIWKPFPARRVESWRDGWGIMADDWFAGLYASLVLWLARQLAG
jgi:phosphatidylglycerophosphatase A